MSDDALLGTVLGKRYRLEVLLGSGKMGRVYRAEHALMKKALAVKVMHAEHTKNPELVARFEREATAAANIEHPNVVQAMDFGKLDDGTVYLALELVEGKNLRAEVAGGALEVRRALHIARQIAAGLAAAHARNIVHRDLKPENIVLIEKDGDPDFVKILDFGMAKLAPESGKSPLTKVGVVLGTLDYMAPEQALGQPVDHRADLYALGAVTYEMLSGACPYEGESSSAILGLQLTKPPPSLRERNPTLAVPGAVEALVMKLLAKERNDRPASAAAVVAELDRLGASAPKGAAVASSPTADAKRPPGPPRPAARNNPTFLPSDPLPTFTFPPLEEQGKKLGADVQQALRAKAAPPVSRPPGTPPPAPIRQSSRPPGQPPPAPIRTSRPPGGPPRAPSRPAAPPGIVSSSPAVDSLLAAPVPAERVPLPPTPSPMSSSPSVDALLAPLPPVEKPAPPPPDASLEPSSPKQTSAGAVDLRARAGKAIEAAVFWIDDNRRFLPRFIKRPLRRVPSGALLLGLVVLAAALVLAIVLAF
jgi:serine/threonine protein kinase